MGGKLSINPSQLPKTVKTPRPAGGTIRQPCNLCGCFFVCGWQQAGEPGSWGAAGRGARKLGSSWQGSPEAGEPAAGPQSAWGRQLRPCSAGGCLLRLEPAEPSPHPRPQSGRDLCLVSAGPQQPATSRAAAAFPTQGPAAGSPAAPLPAAPQRLPCQQLPSGSPACCEYYFCKAGFYICKVMLHICNIGFHICKILLHICNIGPTACYPTVKYYGGIFVVCDGSISLCTL